MSESVEMVELTLTSFINRDSSREVTMRMLKKRYGLLVALLALLPLAAISAGGTVFAQGYCGIQIGSMKASTQYYGSSYYGQNQYWNIQLTVPISLSCPNAGGQLWAVANAYDTVANTNLGSANIAMNFNNGYYSGQLVFTLPPSVVEHLLQVQISVYSNYNNGQYGSLVATTSPTVTIHSSSSYNSSSYYNSPSYPYYGYPYYGYSNGYYNGYPSYCYYDGGYMYCYYQSYYYYYPSPYYYSSNCSNGEAMIYYDGSYYYVTCYHHDR